MHMQISQRILLFQAGQNAHSIRPRNILRQFIFNLHMECYCPSRCVFLLLFVCVCVVLLGPFIRSICYLADVNSFSFAYDSELFNSAVCACIWEQWDISKCICNAKATAHIVAWVTTHWNYKYSFIDSLVAVVRAYLAFVSYSVANWWRMRPIDV